MDTGTDQSLEDATRLAHGGIVMVGLGGVVASSGDGALLLFGEAGVKIRPPP